MNDSNLPLLSALETRVLGVLVEKELTTPDYYPLTLNALTAGCNQKTSRDPVMNVAEDEVQEALDRLRGRGFLVTSVGASRRVERYGHCAPKVLGTDPGTTALLAALMLRGPQTPGELRIACDRMYRFSDLSSVEAYLEQMASRSSGALVVRLPKQAGSREHRWAQLLNGPLETADAVPGQVTAIASDRLAALEAEVARLREEFAELRSLVREFRNGEP
jgi:uncharacterized protein